MKENIVIENQFIYDFNFLNSPKKFNDVYLYQIGEIFCNSQAVVEEHLHDNFFELSFIISGTGKMYGGENYQQVKPNDLFISLPFEKHEILSDTIDPLRYYYIAFAFDKDSEYNKIINDPSIINLPSSMRIFNSPNFASQFVELISTIESKALYSSKKFELLVKILCINVFQIYKQLPYSQYSSPTIDAEQHLYYNIIKYIDHHLLTINHLTEISNQLNYSYIYISRIFKKKFGKSIYTYYSDKKLELAKALLEEDKMSVTEISDYLNYSSIYVFSRVFKKKYGISPSEYKNRPHDKKAFPEYDISKKRPEK